MAGSVLRRVIRKALAKDFGDAIQEATAPFQFALQTRAGTDAVGQALRLLTDLHPERVVISLDGIGAYDHVLRTAMPSRLARMPTASSMLPFVEFSRCCRG